MAKSMLRAICLLCLICTVSCDFGFGPRIQPPTPAPYTAPDLSKSSLIVVYRPAESLFRGFGRRGSVIYIDDVPEARLLSGRYFITVIPAGKHFIYGDERPYSPLPNFILDVRAKTQYYVRFDLLNGHDTPTLVPAAQGQNDVLFLRPIDDRDNYDPNRVSAATAGPPVSPPVPANALSNQNIIDMARAGVADWVIIKKIRNSPTDFNLSADKIVDLKHEGVNETIISVMIDVSTPPPAPKL